MNHTQKCHIHIRKRRGCMQCFDGHMILKFIAYSGIREAVHYSLTCRRYHSLLKYYLRIMSKRDIGRLLQLLVAIQTREVVTARSLNIIPKLRFDPGILILDSSLDWEGQANAFFTSIVNLLPTRFLIQRDALKTEVDKHHPGLLEEILSCPVTRLDIYAPTDQPFRERDTKLRRILSILNSQPAFSSMIGGLRMKTVDAFANCMKTSTPVLQSVQLQALEKLDSNRIEIFSSNSKRPGVAKVKRHKIENGKLIIETEDSSVLSCRLYQGHWRPDEIMRLDEGSELRRFIANAVVRVS